MMKKKTLLPIGCAAGFFGVGAAIHSASANTVPYETLPTGHFSGPSSAGTIPYPAPSSIPATEKVDGVYLARPSEDVRKRNEQMGYKFVGFFSTEKGAKAYTAATTSYPPPPPDPDAPRSCFGVGTTNANTSRAQLYQYVPRPVPSTSATVKKPPPPPPPRPGVKPPPPPKPYVPPKRPDVSFVHVEKLVVDSSGKGTIEATDVWADIETLGVRLISRSSVPLTRIASGPGGLDIFAARDEKAINFLIGAPTATQVQVDDKDKDAFQRFVQNTGNRITVQLNGFSALSSDCGHLKVALDVEKGSGQMATVITTAILPPGPPEETEDSDTRGGGNNDEDDDTPSAPPPPRPGTRQVRTRVLLSNLSISQTSTEKNPVLSVTFGWAGKDRRQSF